ncbi:hypothetical protein KKB44_00610 [Candidatus Micrarchaeota archaeon]|nr:hypothetical protein [Candidatus Micrarchaeota archaeon]
MMFDGNKNCNICNKDINDNQRKYGRSLSGRTYVFCSSCFSTKKEQIKKMLHETEEKR